LEIFPEEIIGKGNMGVICRGNLNGSPVAVKMISEVYRLQSEAEEYFEREEKIACKCVHKNIVRILPRRRDEYAIVHGYCFFFDLEFNFGYFCVFPTVKKIQI
jgi:serine/threonine protein kinase